MLTLVGLLYTTCIIDAVIVHVLPASHDSSTFTQCSTESNVQCYHLEELFNNSLFLNTLSNTTINFYPGVHTIGNAGSADKVISINNVTSLKLIAASQREGATIKCESNIGLVFSWCTNLSIIGIKIEGCGAYLAPQHHNYNGCIAHPVHKPMYYAVKMFTLCIYNSLNVHISNATVTNGNGIGLLVANIRRQFDLSYSIFNNARRNLYLFYDEDWNNALLDTIICIRHSRFVNNDSNVSLPGVHIILLQTQYKVKAEIINTTLEQGNMFNIVIDFNNDKNQVSITNVTSISPNFKYGMRINSIITKCDCNSLKTIPNTVLNNAYFKQGGLVLIYTHKNKYCYCGSYIILSNIIIDRVQTFFTLLLSKVYYAIIVDLTIQHSAGKFQVMNSDVLIRHYFSFIQNNSTVQFYAQSKMIIENNTKVIITENFDTVYSPLFFAEGSALELYDNTILRIEKNNGQLCGGLLLFNSTIAFKGKSRVVFTHNSGIRGGAIALYQKSKFTFHSGYAEILLSENYAKIKGGAMYIQDIDYAEYFINSHQLNAAFRTSSQLLLLYKRLFGLYGGNYNFYFKNNSAGQAGNAIYGGFKIGNEFHFNDSAQNNVSLISSDPFQVCVCINSKHNCNIKNRSVDILPGQSYQLEVVAIGQREGIVPSTVQATFDDHSLGKLQRIEYIQAVGKKCSTVTYTIEFSSETELIQLTTTELTWMIKIPFSVKFHRKICNAGFIWNIGKTKCICDHHLTDHGIECNIQTLKVKRLNTKWVSVTYEHLSSNQQPGVIVHDYCPFDYCIGITQSLSLHYPNQQCNFNRSGILCGGCKTNYSHVLGTSKCKQCNNHWMLLIVPLIAIAGVLLVVSLMLLNLTVSVGTINGLIFYANIVRAKHSTFFSHDAPTSFLSIFIAWLNLDLGIETCFYNGLDAYFITWFQFLFPLYIWLILITIVVVSHFSTRISKLIGNNAVQVLATLFLLSYTKLLRIIITVFSTAVLVYPDGYHRRVWRYDGNVDYLKGKHVPLFMAALILLIFVSFPFTMVLLCIQCMQRLSNKRVLSWVAKLQPLFDAYTGPYRIKHRYWTGLLLLTRVCLFLVFSLNTIGNRMINLLATCIAMSCLLAYLSLVGGVYKLWWLNVIETAFILNLLILSSGSLYQINAGSSIKPISYTSTSIALGFFIGILIYHVIIKLTKTKLGQRAKSKFTDCLQSLTNVKSRDQNRLNYSLNQVRSLQPKDVVTYSEIKLEEPLLEGN